ncbi:MAG: DUF3524 domain-containing protein [Flavobacteriales bacterium]|nr:DUF3524 domain-containing protein [Flavobacteriales bacterium]
MLRVALVEPFFSGSHASWANGLKKHSSHDITLFTLPGRHWKWRMTAGAVPLAHAINESAIPFDVCLATSMTDVALLKALVHKANEMKFMLYMHENQVAYPWSPNDEDVNLKRDRHYIYKQFASALAADHIAFNSAYNQSSFLEGLPDFLRVFPDFQGVEYLQGIRQKSSILPLGLDLQRFDIHQCEDSSDVPLVLWNHRWEFDKNPELFFETLVQLHDEGVPFSLAVLGEQYRDSPPIFEKARQELDSHIVHWGYADTFEEYARWLWKADVLPVTSRQDFFGISMCEAVYCGASPILPERLAFPEIINDQACYYRTEQEFKALLREGLTRSEKRRSYRGRITRFDWSNQKLYYDKWLAKPDEYQQ